jgi:ribonuclease D
LALHESEVEWVDTVDKVERLVKLVRRTHVVGVDLEWASAGPWSDSSLALLQLATPTRVFLVDLAVPATQVSVGSLLGALLGSDTPLVVCFSFHNDLRELATSPWAAATKDVKGLADLQRLNVGGAREGLGGMVQRTLQRPLCKAEQRSYWHRRPLRAAQRHYAALDAFVLLQLASTLTGASLKEPEKMASTLRELCGSLQKTRAVAGVQVRTHRVSQSEVGIP